MKKMKEEGLGSYPTIREALAYRSRTWRAHWIRERALELGGVVMEPEKQMADVVAEAVERVVGAVGKGGDGTNGANGANRGDGANGANGAN